VGIVDAYLAFIAKTNEILANSFSAEALTQTKRSGGLDPQVGLIIGLSPDTEWTEILCSAITKLPEVWSGYDHTTLHSTLGAFEDRTITQPTPELRQSYDGLVEVANTYAGFVDSGTAALKEPRILASADTLVLAGLPTITLFELRGWLTNPRNEKVIQAGIKPGWGSHITLARAQRPLTNDDRAATTLWMRALQAMLGDSLKFSAIMAGMFQVEADGFGFVESITAPLAM
jgi:hypothetical protein